MSTDHLVRNVVGKLRRNPTYHGRKIYNHEIRLLFELDEQRVGLSPEDVSRAFQIPLSAVILAQTEIRKQPRHKQIKPIRRRMPSNALLSSIKKTIEHVPRWDRGAIERYDQCFAEPRTVVSRLRLMWQRGDLHGRRILLLGDDDLLSIGLARSSVCRKVTTIEIDEHLRRTLRTWARAQRSRLEVIPHDYRNSLPKNLHGGFDVVFADPPYTIAGLSLCLRRAREALAGKQGGILYLCFSPMDLSLDSLMQLHRIILESGMVILEIQHDFNHYVETTSMKQEVVALGHAPTKGWFASSIARLIMAKTSSGNALVTSYGNHGDIYDYKKWK